MYAVRTYFLFFKFFSVSQVGAALMGDTAGTSHVSRPKHDVQTQFLAKYVNKTRILTCMIEHLNRKMALRAKILMQNVLNDKFHRETLPRSDVSR